MFGPVCQSLSLGGVGRWWVMRSQTIRGCKKDAIIWMLGGKCRHAGEGILISIWKIADIPFYFQTLAESSMLSTANNDDTMYVFFFVLVFHHVCYFFSFPQEGTQSKFCLFALQSHTASALTKSASNVRLLLHVIRSYFFLSSFLSWKVTPVFFPLLLFPPDPPRYLTPSLSFPPSPLCF